MSSPHQWVDAHNDPAVASRLLRLAAIHGDTEALRHLLEAGINVNRIDPTDARDLPDSNPGKTALHYAAWHGRAESVALLLMHGANPNARRLHGDTPLLEWVRGQCNHDVLSAHRDYPKTAVLLLQAGADPHASQSCPAGSAWNAAALKNALPALLRAMAEVKASRDGAYLERQTHAVELVVADTRRL